LSGAGSYRCRRHDPVVTSRPRTAGILELTAAMAISVLILTRDEETNIAGCLASVRWCDDVVLLDSSSTDRTTEIARAGGARIVTRAFDDYASQRNFGLQQIEWRHPWVLMLDADERVSPELAAEMQAAVRAAPESVCLIRMRRADYLLGRRIRGSSGNSTWFPRLARLGRVWVERPINEEYRTDGDERTLRQHLHHYSFNNGFAAWIAKHNRYSSMEADVMARDRDRVADKGWSGLLARDPLVRRRVLKRLLYRLPLRPLVVFFGSYLLKGGILDGRAGLTYALLRSWYELAIDLKVIEIDRRSKNLSV
jgi:glycosyltransferase involved in cell wall biosynthesis